MEKYLRILLVDDREEFREELSLWLREILEHEVEEAADLESALELFKRDPERFDAALVDYGLAGDGKAGNGIELMQELHCLKEHLPVIVITGAGDRDIAQQALSKNAFWYLEKPLDPVETEKLLDWVSRYRKTGERIEQFRSEQFSESHAVMAVSHLIASATEIAEILATIKTKALEFFGADLCGLLIVDTETGEVTGLPENQAQEEERLQEEMRTIAQDLITRGKPFNLRLEGKSKDFKVLLACPCPPQEQGVFQESGPEVLFALFRSDLEEKKLEALELKLIALARLVGVAVERIRQRRLMEALVGSSKRLLEVSSEKQIFKLVADQITTNFKHSAFYLALYHRASRTIQLPLLYHQGRDVRDLVPESVLKDLATRRPTESWLGYVIDTKEEFEVEDGENPDLPARSYSVLGTTARSYFGVPLYGQDGSVLGVLSLQSASKRKFPQSSKQAFRTLATLVAPAIERVRHAEAIRRRQEAERHVREQVDRNRLAEVLDEKLKEVWPDNPVHVDLLLADRGNRQLIHEGRTDLPAIRFGQGLAGLVAETGTTLLFQGETLKDLPAALHPLSQSALCVPIKLGDSFLGVLNVETPEPSFFGAEDHLFLERVAKSVATILVASGRRASAEAVIEIAVKAATHPEQGLKILTQNAHEIASHYGGAPNSTTVFLLTGEILELVSVWPEHLFEEMYEKIGKLLLDPPAGKPRGYVALAARERETKFVEKVILEEGNAKEGKARQYDPDYISFDGKTRAQLAVPVLAADQNVIGVLNLEYENPKALNEEDRRLIEALADQAGIVAVLQQQARELAEKQSQRTTLVMLGVEAADREHSWINETSALKNELGNFVTVANRVADSTQSSSYRILRRLRVVPNIDGEMLRSIASSVEQSIGAYKELDLTEQHIQEKTFIDVESWLRDLVKHWSKRESGVSFPVDPQTAPTDLLYANKYWLTRAMKNLISNAVRASKKASNTPKVKLSSYRSGKNVHIEVSDNGPGIPEQVQAYLFKEMIPKEELTAGRHGIGCLLTHFIAQEYGGRAFFLPSDEGAKVILELPLASISSEVGAQ